MMTEKHGDVRPDSNFVDMKLNRDNHERKFSTMPRSYGASSRYQQQQQQQIPRNRVKFEPRNVFPSMMANGYEKTVKEVPKKKKEINQPPPVMAYSSDSEFDIVTNCQFNTDESEKESIYDDDDSDYTKRTFEEMESKMNAMTNKYFHKIKSQLSATCSKLKVQQKHSIEKPKAQLKVDEKAAGDTRAFRPENDSVIRNFKKIKADCYSKIDENLKILQQIDSVNDKLSKNYMFNQN